jgi:hypothetical protein
MEWVEIASADDDMIAGTVLEWSGLFDLCVEHELDLELDLVSDVLDLCDHAMVERESWDAGAPGRSGVWHVVLTDDPERLKVEIRTRIEEFIRERE